MDDDAQTDPLPSYPKEPVQPSSELVETCNIVTINLSFMYNQMALQSMYSLHENLIEGRGHDLVLDRIRSHFWKSTVSLIVAEFVNLEFANSLACK